MIAREAIDLILESEGLDQPSKWPGAESGITLGRGYDLGYATRSEFQRDWAGHLSAGELARLSQAIRKTGSYARRIAAEYRDIRISRAAADAVFQTSTLPKWEAITQRAFPGSEQLPARAFGALVSLTFNRGPSLVGDRRAEMLEIRDAIEAHFDRTPTADVRPLLRTIASEIRSMKRLWIGKGLDGLLTRREAEARMVETAL